MRKPMRAFERWRQDASAVFNAELPRASAQNPRGAVGPATLRRDDHVDCARPVFVARSRLGAAA